MSVDVKSEGFKKFLKICEKYLLSLFTGLMLTFIVLLIIVSCQTNGAKYYYEGSILNQSIKMEFELKESTYTYYLSGYFNNELVSYNNGNYKIEDGTLYSISMRSGNKVIEKEGKINAYQLELDTSNLESMGLTEEQIASFKDLKLYCKTNVTLKNISIAFICIYGAGAIGCLVLLILDKTGVLNPQNKKPAKQPKKQETKK